jgi:hypothetical protein
MFIIMDNVLIADNIGIFFSCYKEREAVSFCIDNIRNYYPQAPIYLASDGGYDFSDLCEQGNIKFSMYDDVLGYVNNPESKEEEKLIFCCREFLSRIKDALEYCKTEYILYYEPDVLLRGKIKTNPNSDLSGSFANIIHSNVISLIEKYNPVNTNINFGACGGSLIKTSTLKRILENTNDTLLKELIYTDKRISNCDYLLTVLFCIFGYQYLENIDFIEANRNQNWESTSHSIVHQYHKHYLKNYDGKYKKP